MVHRAPDSRLLTNLIASEKEYAKHLASLFPMSHTALTSLSVYAAASPSFPARTIAAVVDLLASADDALQRYHSTIEAWRDQLVALKDLEDDLSAVLRDRDILVTRLIKVSKATRDAHRSSRLIAPLTSGLGSASLSSLPSTNSTTTHSAGTGSSANAKLAQAQAELQACETHLVTKERELDNRRINIARDGLGARCRALIDCGWVWGEMGKQGLKALQALSVSGAPTSNANANGNGVAHIAVPSHPTYASDNSSVTPSQSASQTATRSAGTSHEGPTAPREREPGARTKNQTDLTIALPPAHAIPDLTLPTGVRSQPPQNGDPTTQKHTGSGSENGVHAKPAVAVTPAVVPAPRRKRAKRPRRPPSQLIAEVSDEGSGGPLPPPNPDPDADPGIKPSPRTPFPITRPANTTITAQGAQETSSDDEQPVGSFKVVENDPFAVMRRSMLAPSPSAPHLPAVPVVSASAEMTPSNMAFADVAAGRGTATGVTPATKRERRTSMAFFGSLRGLFRKPKERGRVDIKWDEEHASPKPNGHVNGHGRGWVTRTDARIKGRDGTGDVDSDDDRDRDHNRDQNGGGDATRVVNVSRGSSGTRLRKGRLRGMNGSGVDGWATDSRGLGAGASVSVGAGLDRAQTRRGTIRPKKTSVADLRGSEQGHTDGEVDGRLPLEQVASKGRSTAETEEEPGRPVARRPSVLSKGVPLADGDVLHRRATTTGQKISETHRRSASLPVVDVHVASVSTMTGRKPSLPQAEVESGSRPASPVGVSRSKTTTGPTKPVQYGRRHPSAQAHAQNQSLMSLVADVTGSEDKGRDRARSSEIPRASGSVVRQEVGRKMSLTTGTGPVRSPMPLRSALRNASRTPSPAPAREDPAPAPAAMGEKNRGVEEEGDVPVRDSMSISSYETGRESLGGEEERTPSPGPMITFPPPPVDPPPGMKNEGPGTGAVIRRKSVRVSLQPTFSPSPPALHDEDGEEYGYGYGRGSSTRRSGDVDDVWADSTSEEEVYRRARGLLSMAGKLDTHGKGKGRR